MTEELPLMALGLFVFALKTLPYQELRRATQFRHPTQDRVGARPLSQYLGPGDDQITLSGVLMPELTGGAFTLDALRLMATPGKGWPLIEGTGRLFGLYAIVSIEETASHLLSNGAGQRIEFSLALQRVDDWPDLMTAATDAVSSIASAISF